MTMIKKLFIPFILFGFSTTSFAECKNANVYADIACYENELKNSKTKLNQTYQKLHKSMDSEGKAILERAQKDWLNYKNSHCDELQAYVAQDSLGAGTKLINLSCNVELIQTRIQQLKNLE